MSSSNNTSIILGRSEIPPYSPIYWKPPVEWTPETFSRDRSRVRSVFDDHVERAKALKHEKPAKAHAKKRAQRLGLQVDIIEAKGLSWRAIQAQPPVVLTAGPTSPARTVMQPALYYPSAERYVPVVIPQHNIQSKLKLRSTQPLPLKSKQHQLQTNPCPRTDRCRRH